MALVRDTVTVINPDGSVEFTESATRDSNSAPSKVRFYWGYISSEHSVLPGQMLKYTTEDVKA